VVDFGRIVRAQGDLLNGDHIIGPGPLLPARIASNPHIVQELVKNNTVEHVLAYGDGLADLVNSDGDAVDEHGHRKRWENNLIWPRRARERKGVASLILADSLKGLLSPERRENDITTDPRRVS